MVLLEYPANELLEKYGAGDVKPGSGSAAALTSLIAAEMIITVCDVSLRSIKDSKIVNELINIKNQANNKFIPILKRYHQEDSDLFKTVSDLRTMRDLVKSQEEKVEYKKLININLRPCIEIPLKIMEIAGEIAVNGLYIFENGVWWVKGDSQVSISNAISVMESCESIINLNLNYLADDEWTRLIRSNLKKLKDKCESLKDENNVAKKNLELWSKKQSRFKAKINELGNKLIGKRNINNEQIEALATDLLNTLYIYKYDKDVKLSNQLKIIDSKKALEKYNFKCKFYTSLGTNEYNEEIAGIIDTSIFEVGISEMWPLNTQNFTLAHELGHALLHNDIINHRERPFEKYGDKVRRPLKEYQADKFASYFLMPKKVVIQVFQNLFKVDQIIFNEDNSYAIANLNISDLKKSVKSLRDWSKLVASCEFYNTQPITSMANIFKVSNEAMAIRLEELALVKY